MTSRDDRIKGVLLGTAAGDALGAPYEFEPPRGPELEVAMVGGGVWEPGEWTDDTAMAIAIAEVAATGADLRERWRRTPSSVDGLNGHGAPKTLAFRPVQCCEKRPSAEPSLRPGLVQRRGRCTRVAGVLRATVR